MWLGPRTGEILLPANNRASGDPSMSKQLSVLERGTSPNSRTAIGMLEVPSSVEYTPIYGPIYCYHRLLGALVLEFPFTSQKVVRIRLSNQMMRFGASNRETRFRSRSLRTASWSTEDPELFSCTVSSRSSTKGNHSWESSSGGRIPNPTGINLEGMVKQVMQGLEFLQVPGYHSSTRYRIMVKTFLTRLFDTTNSIHP